MTPLIRNLEDVSEEQIKQEKENAPVQHALIMSFKCFICEDCNETHDLLITAICGLN